MFLNGCNNRFLTHPHMWWKIVKLYTVINDDVMIGYNGVTNERIISLLPPIFCV